MNKLDFRRLRMPLAAGAAMGLAIITLDVLLAMGFGERCAWLPPAFGTPRLADFQGRLARFEQMKQSGAVADEKLVAVLGLSQVRYDLDPVVLKANDPRHRDWLILGGDGRSFDQLALLGRVLTESNVRPQLVVLCVAKSMTNRNDSDENSDSLKNLPGHLRRHEYFPALRDGSWLARHRLEIEEESALVNDRATAWVRAAFGLPMAVTYEPESDPWSIWVVNGTTPTDAAALKRQWEGRMSLFAADQYEHVEGQIAALKELVAGLRGHGARVVCVLMPESERLRGLYTPLIAERFDEAVAAASAGDALTVINLREEMPDSAFHDDAHLTPEGRRQFSGSLPARIP